VAVHLTDRVIRGLPAPVSGNRITRDNEVVGFGARVTAAGARSWVLKYRAYGRERCITIGAFPDWPAKPAREQAKSLKRRIDLGEDPMGARSAERAAPTVEEFAKRYLEDAAKRKRPSSVAGDRAMLAKEILPKLGKIKIARLHRRDVEPVFHEFSTRAPISANRMLALISTMHTRAVGWELREGPNPTASIVRNPETKRERYLTAEEVGRLLAAVARCRNQQSANIIRLALLTGARRGELLGATWSQFDLAPGLWRKPASLTKQKKLHVIPLNGPALELLSAMRVDADRENSRRVRDGLAPIEHVFPGRFGREGGQGWIKAAWVGVCKRAELTDLRFHDLRHAFASFLVSSGHNLPLIGQLLGHSSPETTSRYAHLLLDPQREATERVGSIITGANPAKPSAEVVPMAGSRRA
jgi:integrase